MDRADLAEHDGERRPWSPRRRRVDDASLRSRAGRTPKTVGAARTGRSRPSVGLEHRGAGRRWGRVEGGGGSGGRARRRAAARRESGRRRRVAGRLVALGRRGARAQGCRRGWEGGAGGDLRRQAGGRLRRAGGETIRVSRHDRADRDPEQDDAKVRGDRRAQRQPAEGIQPEGRQRAPGAGRLLSPRRPRHRRQRTTPRPRRTIHACRRSSGPR